MTLGTAAGALLDDSRRRAQAIAAESEEEAAQRIAAARHEAEGLIAQAREEGAAEARAEATLTRTTARFAARMQVLAAQRASYDELLARARAAAIALREDPAYEELLEGLAAEARAVLGAGAELTVDPPGMGGVIATAGSRRVDLSLCAIAERCVRDLGRRVNELWA